MCKLLKNMSYVTQETRHRRWCLIRCRERWRHDGQRFSMQAIRNPCMVSCSASSVDRCVHSLMSSLQALRGFPIRRVPSAIKKL